MIHLLGMLLIAWLILHYWGKIDFLLDRAVYEAREKQNEYAAKRAAQIHRAEMEARAYEYAQHKAQEAANEAKAQEEAKAHKEATAQNARKAFENWINELEITPSTSNSKTVKELMTLRQSMRPWEEQ